MNNKLFSKMLPVAAVATSAILMFGSVPAAYADSGTVAVKPPTGAPSMAAMRAPVSVTMAQLNQRVGQVPQLAGLQNGDKVIISDDGSVTGTQFQGTYIYHPAGTQVPLGPMYARWKDGLVAIHMSTDPANASNAFTANALFPFATYVDQTHGTGTDYAGNPIQVLTSQKQVTAPLIQEPTNSAILRLADNAWLFRDAGNGKYVALTDVFVFQTGNAPMTWEISPTTGQSVWNADGVQQPVGVMNQG